MRKEAQRKALWRQVPKGSRSQTGFVWFFKATAVFDASIFEAVMQLSKRVFTMFRSVFPAILASFLATEVVARIPQADVEGN
jgi:hypothetical protein